MLIAGDLLGRRRIWPAAIGLLIAAWSRQLTILYGAAVIGIAWTMSESVTRRSIALCCGLLAVGVPLALNSLKFGNPFESGYQYVYAGRESDWYGRRVMEHGVFSPHYIPENA